MINGRWTIGEFFAWGSRRRSCGRLVIAVATPMAIFAVAGCASIERLPAVPYAQAPRTEVLDIPDARFYVSDTNRIYAIALKAYQRRTKVKAASATQYFLAISGGGDDGAFGSGLLAGWADRGDMPSFDVVTGVSTGSLSAPFAFLGREYDSQLREVYTETTASDVAERRSPLLSAAAGDALFGSGPLREMISRHVDSAMVRRIGEEYAKGRLLFVLTTNLDQGRPVIWNIGSIAASGNPNARELIIDVLLASASIPAVFPPVMINVTVDGQKYQEMHVDGGTIAQAFLYPPSVSLKQAAVRLKIDEKKLRAARKRVAYIIRNGRLSRAEEDVKVQTLAIARQAINTMITSSGVNDTYRMYLTAQRDGVDFNLASIRDDFNVPYREPFDKDYMRAVFDYGYEKGRAGYAWQKTPPGYAN
ncbi:MAG TPA: patatin-like phospholipase family protein [Pseudolabrys sp.]|nr:patatin-like phospholipase family protein [Pseudolabrys sp.]